MRRALYAAAVIFSLLLSQPFSCSAEDLERSVDQMERALLTTAEELTIAEETTSSFESTLETTVETPREPRAYLVPVAHLTSRRESVSLEELSRVRELAVPRELRGPLEERLGGVDLEPLDSPEGVLDLVSQDPGAIGLVPWEDVDPRVKALAVNGVHPLRPGAEVPENYPLDLGEADGPDSGKLRRVVIGGDMVLDRGLHHAVFQQGRGIDFPLDGGRAAVTWRASEPSEYSEFGEIHQFRAERRGEPGAVREYLNGADLALANLESPVLANATYHPEGTTFHGDLGLLPILADAGIDGVTLANNHVLDAGEAGLAETMLHLDDAGIAHAGAGMDLASAREPMVFDLGGVKVGVLNYQNVPSYEWAWATEGTAGTAPLREDVLREDIRRLESRVDTVIVMPHWGEEYTATPEPEQVELARSAVDAGADLVAGGHAHWAKGIEVYEGAPVFYGVGNFLFDQVWSEETSTGIFAEVTLYEDRVIQTKPVPFIVLDYGQPNFLLPNGGGKRALNTIFSASLGSEFDGEE